MSSLGNTYSGRWIVQGLIILVAIGAGAAVMLVGPEAAAGIPGLLAGLAVLTRPIFGLVALIFPFPFEDAILFEGVGTVTKMMGLAVAGLWFVHKILRGESWRATLSAPLVIVAIVFIAFATSSFIWAESTRKLTTEVFRLGLLLALVLLVLDLARKWDHVVWLIRALVVGGIIASTLVAHEYFVLGVRRAGEGVGGGANSTGIILVTLLPFGFLLLRSGQQILWRSAGLIYVVSALVAIAVTFSRMSFLLVPLVLLFEVWETLRKGRGRVALMLFTAAALIVAIRFFPLEEVKQRAETIGPYLEATISGGSPERPTMSARGYHLYIALKIFQDHPLIGVGYANYGHQFLQYQLSVPGAPKLYESERNPHSSFTGILAELGLVGISLWLALLGVAMHALFGAWRQTCPDRSSREFLIVRAVTISFLLMLPYGFYAQVQYEKIFWLILGLTVVLYRVTRESSPEDDGYRRRDGEGWYRGLPTESGVPDSHLVGFQSH